MAFTSEQERLWANVSSFPLDDTGDETSFIERLRREHGWSTVFSRRVVGEYRKFLLLAATTEEVVVPSDAVDQAWHQHLVDTRSYWERFCVTVIGKPVHHTPSRGGDAEQQFHGDRYAATLVLYRAVFEEGPPEDIWPAPDARFAARCRRVDLRHYWLIPRVMVHPALAMLAGLSTVVYAAISGAPKHAFPALLVIAVVIVIVGRATWEAHQQQTRSKDGSTGTTGCFAVGGCHCPGGDAGGCSGGCGGCS